MCLLQRRLEKAVSMARTCRAQAESFLNGQFSFGYLDVRAA